MIWVGITGGGYSQGLFLTQVRCDVLSRWLHENCRGAYPFVDEEAHRDPNAGIEMVVLLLRSSAQGRSLLAKFDPDAFTDTDHDGREEICDGWGTPLVYEHHQNYGKSVLVMDVDRGIVAVEAAVVASGFLHPNSFQLFSVSLSPDELC